jgi:K+-transporting ATPase c subunit
MSPLRDGRQAGAMCFVVKADGSIVRPNDGICNSVAVSDHWNENGWLESTGNLGQHPSPEPRR